MVTKFDAAFNYVLSNEGGLSDHPADRGGLTRYGITRDEAAKHGYDVANLTLNQAKGIYKSEYWVFENVRSEAVATKLFDMGVNFGLRTAIALVQRIVGVNADGQLGPLTERAINAYDPQALMRELQLASLVRYARICRANLSQTAFLEGWVRRAFRTPAA